MAIHGINVTEGALGAPPINLPDVSNIGLVGTAPDASLTGKFTDAAGTAVDLNQPFLITSRADANATDLGTTGTLPGALDAIFAQTRAKVVFGIVEEAPIDTTNTTQELADAATAVNALGDIADETGVYALLNAESVVGVRPNLICVPDLDTGSGDSTTANALGAALNTIAGRLRAIALIAGPNSNHSDATTKFVVQYGGDRTYLIDPYVKVADGATIVERDATPFVAGVIVKNDAENGWWRSPSNKLINGVLGTARPIDFVMGDAASRAQLLNDVGVATIVNIGGGYRLWGNETPAEGDRAPWKFLNVRRIADVLYKAIQDNHLWAVDQGITRTYFDAVTQGVNSFIKTLISQQALIAGECFPDADLNTAANIANGEAHFNVRYTPVYPAQTVLFKVDLNTAPLGSIVG